MKIVSIKSFTVILKRINGKDGNMPKRLKKLPDYVSEELTLKEHGYTPDQAKYAQKIVAICTKCGTPRSIVKRCAYHAPVCAECTAAPRLIQYRIDVVEDPHVDAEETKRRFGYLPKDAPTSKSRIILLCRTCGGHRETSRVLYYKARETSCAACANLRRKNGTITKIKTELEVPCGTIVPTSKGRCDDHSFCIHYEDCLNDVVDCDPKALRWKGWRKKNAA
jgi:hypothetical protein